MAEKRSFRMQVGFRVYNLVFIGDLNVRQVSNWLAVSAAARFLEWLCIPIRKNHHAEMTIRRFQDKCFIELGQCGWLYHPGK